MIPAVTTDSVFRVPSIQTTTAGTATNGTATVSLYNAPHQKPLWQQGSWQQRSVSQFPPSAVRIPQFLAGNSGLVSSSSTSQQFLHKAIHVPGNEKEIRKAALKSIPAPPSFPRRRESTTAVDPRLRGDDDGILFSATSLSVEDRESFSELKNLKKMPEYATIAYNDSQKETEDALDTRKKFTEDYEKSVNEVEQSKSKVMQLEVHKEYLKTNLKVARKNINDLEEWNASLKNENDSVWLLYDSSVTVTQNLIEKLKEENYRLKVYQENYKQVLDEFSQAIEDFNKAAEDENASMKRQLDLSEGEASEGKKNIKKLKEELEEKNKNIQELKDTIKNEYSEQKVLLKPLHEDIITFIKENDKAEELKSKLNTTKEQLQKLKESIASVTGCSTASSCEDLMGSMAALKRKLNAPEAHSSTLSAQHQAVIESESKIDVIVLDDE